MVTVVLASAQPRRHFHVLQSASAEHLEVHSAAQATPLPRHHPRFHLSCCSPRECAFVREIARAHLQGSILVVGAGHEGSRHCSAELQEQVEELKLSQSACV